MTQGWSWYVIALVTLNIVGCVWLLWWTGRRKPGDPAPTDTSHVWDGDITEYNKPMPRWWINMFYLTIAFAIGYLALYPGFGSFAGTKQWSSAREHDAEQAAENRKLEATFARFAGQSIDVLARDPHARELGRGIFANTCAGCHGSTAQGANGYPDLTDDIWHWGGTPERVLQSVLDGREGVMPPWGKVLTGMGGDNAVDYTVAYVRSLATPTVRKDYLAAQGKPLYESVCTACHGVDGKGNAQLGAPDLTDDYWLYGNDSDSLAATIRDGRHGSMPAWRPLLGETRARLAAAYVWSLSQPPTTKQ
ncbi:MAG TPA: cytochrome-c oxidase, cbb3-type subunit III [Rhodanobacter sp.]|nr:cytochrome-c oxidase, cbb3-type subunit III [Rhodanobacter sp.]